VDGVAKLAGEPVEVRQQVAYQPVNNNESNTLEENMDKEKLIKGLIDDSRTQFGEEHREWLGTLSECQLKTLSPVETGEEPAETTTEPTPDKAPEAPTKAEPKPEPAPVQNASLDEQVDKAVATALAKRDKADLITALAGNKDLGLSETTLEKMDVSELQALQKRLAPANFSGRGWPTSGVASGSDDDTMAMPGVLLGKREVSQ
jgi:hypothetical protein